MTGFDSQSLRQVDLLGIRQVGKAADFDSAIQRFESFIPSQYASMEKQVYSADLKSAALIRHPGSTPGTRTIVLVLVQWIVQ